MPKSLLRSLKVLYAEDDAVHRQEIADFLKRRVGKLYLASDGKDAIEKYKVYQPDIILTDLRMPEVDGLNLTKQIREENRMIPILIMTAMSDKDTILEAVNLNISNYILKPVDADEMISALQEAAESILSYAPERFEMSVEKEKINALKNEMTQYLKKTTGKGPSDVQIQVTDTQAIMVIDQLLTRYELSLLEYADNHKLVTFSREAFFKDRSTVLEEMVGRWIDLKVHMDRVRVVVDEDRFVIVFGIVG